MQEKSLDEFYRNGGKTSAGAPKKGQQLDCKSCMKAFARDFRAKRRQEYDGPKVSEKACVKCQETSSSDNFYAHSATKDGLSSYCKPCQRQSAKDNVVNRDPEMVKVRARAFHLKKNYGISMDEFDQMVEAQQGACALCERLIDRLVVDHDHETGAVRDLLCATCNAGIGMLNDSPELLERAAEYIRSHQRII